MGTLIERVLEAGIVTPLNRTLEHDDADAVASAMLVTVQVAPPTPEPPAREVTILVAPTPVALEAAAVEVATVVEVLAVLLVETFWSLSSANDFEVETDARTTADVVVEAAVVVATVAPVTKQVHADEMLVVLLEQAE